MLHNPCIRGGPQRQARGENQKWPFGFSRVHSCWHSKKNFFVHFFFEYHVSHLRDTPKNMFLHFLNIFYTCVTLHSGSGGQPPGSMGGGGTPKYIPQNDPHIELIILNIHT